MRPSRSLIAALGAWLVAGLAPATASAERGAARYQSQCVPDTAQSHALECPSGTKLAARAGKMPASKMATTERQQEPTKQAAQKGPGISDSVVQQARTGFREQRQKRVEAIIQQEIELTRRLIKNTNANSPEMPPRRLRLAQNYEDLLQTARSSVRELDEPIYQARQQKNQSRVKQLTAEQTQRESKVSEYRGEAIKQYAAIARDFRDYKNRDEVLFRLAFMIEEQASDDRLRNEAAGRPVPTENEKTLREQARRVYRELIKNYQNSRYIPNAFLSFAEYYFQEGEMENALEFYNRVIEYENSDVFGYAVYKMAWVYINLQDDRQAVNQFVRVIEHANANPDARISRPLARQARREIIPPFSRAFPPTQAWAFFQRIGGDEALEMMEALAEHYYNQGQWREAETTYHALMAENAESHRLCFYQARVAECSRRGRPKAEQVLELRRTVDLMNTFLQGRHPAENVTECRQSVAQMVLEVATNWHQESVGSDTAPGTNDPEAMELSSQLYGVALENFEDMDQIQFEGWEDANRPTRYRVAYWAAELLWKRNRWAECGPAFDRVVEINPQGEYLQEAAYAAVLCYNNLYEATNTEDTETRAEKRAPSKRGKRLTAEEEAAAELQRLQSRPLTSVEEGMLNAYSRYICYVAEGEDLVRIKYRRARIHYVANHWEEAATLFRDIAYNHSDDELAPYAANQYLDCLNAIARLNQDRRIACRDELADGVEDFLANNNLTRDDEFRNQVTQLQCGILWSQAEARTEARRFREAADLYARIYSDYHDECAQIGNHDLCEVLYNAAINYESDYRIGQAIQIRTRLFNECGDESEFAAAHGGKASEWAKRAIYQIGGNYHAIASYTKAAQYYEDFARRYSGEKEAPEALQNATVFRIGLGQDDQAIKNMELFVRNYAARREFKAQTARVVFSIGTIFMRRGEAATKANNEREAAAAWKAAENHYSSFLKRYGSAAAADDLVQAYTNLGYAQWMQGEKLRESAVKNFRQAVGVADRGASEGETNKVRLERYRKMIGAGGEEEEGLMKRLWLMVDAVAKSRFYLGEQEYRGFLSVSFPRFKADRTIPPAVSSWHNKTHPEKARELNENLRWMEPEDKRAVIGSVQFQYWIEKEFQPWMKRKDERRAAAEKLYLAVVTEDVPEWEIAAAARVGDMYRQFMKALYDAPIDPSVANDQELIDIYRDALDQAAEPYRDSAIKAFQHCLSESTNNTWFNQWSRSCEAQLNSLDPRSYPISDELRAQPSYQFSPMAIPKLISRLETQAERAAEEARNAAGQQE